jgi:hypothetical protein
MVMQSKWSATTLTVLTCLASGLDLKTANYIAHLGLTIAPREEEATNAPITLQQ